MQSTITARYFSKLKASVSLASGLSKASRHSCRVWESNRQALEISENILYTFRTMGYCLFFVCGKTIMSNFNAFSLAKTPKNPPKHLSYRLVIFLKIPNIERRCQKHQMLEKDFAFLFETPERAQRHTRFFYNRPLRVVLFQPARLKPWGNSALNFTRTLEVCEQIHTEIPTEMSENFYREFLSNGYTSSLKN